MDLFLAFLFFGLISFVSNQKTDPWEVRCHVCKITIYEIENAVAKVDPNKVVNVGGFRLDSEGNSITKTVPYSRSEIFLTDLMETICDKMEDYAKVIHKKTGKTNVIQFLVDGKMNPDIGEYEFVQDGDLNKSLKHYCLEILENHEDAFLKAFMDEKLDDNIDIQICSIKAKYCKDETLPQEEYKYHEEM